MLVGFIVIKTFQQCLYILGIQLAVGVGQGEDLMTGILHRAGFVGVDMTGGGGDDTLKFREHCGDNGGIGLCATYQKLHIGLRALAGSPNFLSGGGTVIVCAIAALYL